MFSTVKEGFCSKLTDEFDKNYNQLIGLENQLNQFVNSLKFNIADNIGFSPADEIRKFQNGVQSNMSKMVPSLHEFDELEYLINMCDFTRNNSMLSKPATMARSIFNQVSTNANNFLSNLATNIPTEFNIASSINLLKNFIGTSGVNLLIPGLNQALNCMSAICGTDITSRFSNLQSFMSRYFINDSGDFEDGLFLVAEGLADEAIGMINSVKDQLDYIQSGIESSFSSGIDRLKSLYPDQDEDD